MATTRICERLRSIRYQEKPRPALWGRTRPEHQPRLLHLLLVLAPLLVGCTVLVPVDGPAALLCGAAAGAVVIAWPWWRLYWAIREHDREHPEGRLRPGWQRWPWGCPHPPEPKTWVDRILEALGIGSAADLSLLVLAEIRQVVEVAVSTGLARLEGSIVTSAQRQVNEDAEAEMLLDDLGSALQLKE